MSKSANEVEGAPNFAPTEQSRSDSVFDGAATPQNSDSGANSDMVFALVLFAVASTNFIVGDGWGSKAWFFPNVIAAGMYLCGAVLGVHRLLQLRKTPRARPKPATAAEPVDTPVGSAPAWLPAFDAAWFIGIFFAYVALLPITGYIVTTSMFFLIVCLALGLGGARWGKRVVYSVLGAAVATTALVMMFEYGFGVPLPGS